MKIINKQITRTIDDYTETYNRFVIIDEKSGEVIDDAQGYGYKTARTASRSSTWNKYLLKNKKEPE